MRRLETFLARLTRLPKTRYLILAALLGAAGFVLSHFGSAESLRQAIAGFIYVHAYPQIEPECHEAPRCILPVCRMEGGERVCPPEICEGTTTACDDQPTRGTTDRAPGR